MVDKRIHFDYTITNTMAALTTALYYWYPSLYHVSDRG